MLIWKGWGLLGLIIPLLLSWTANFGFNYFYTEGFYLESAWAMPLVIGLSSIPVGLVGYLLNRKPGRVLIDPETYERVEIKKTHSMFWLPLQYWSIILIGIAIWMYTANIGLIYTDH